MRQSQIPSESTVPTAVRSWRAGSRRSFTPLIPVLIVALCSGACSSNLGQAPARHIVQVNGKGIPIDPTGDIRCQGNLQDRAEARLLNTWPRCDGRFNRSQAYLGHENDRTLEPSEYEAYLDEIFTNIEQQQPEKRRLLLFIHGGLNSTPKTVKRAIKLTPQIREAGYYPIFINWQSSLVSSWTSHLFHIRQGRYVKNDNLLGVLSATVFLAADLLKAIGRAPVVWYDMFSSDLETWDNVNPPLKQQATDLYCLHRKEFEESLRQPVGSNPSNPVIPISAGPDTSKGWENKFSTTKYMLTIPTKMLVSPVIDAAGGASWNVMNRRTQMLFRTAESCLACSSSAADCCSGEQDLDGGLAVFLRRLQRQIEDTEGSIDWEITLVSHSMGTIVANEILRSFPDLHIDNLVYMAAACSVADYEDSVWPYMRLPQHQDTRMFHLTLHSKAELADRWDKFPGFIDLPPRGSLLVWIDNFLSNPRSLRERTAGRFDNLLNHLPATPNELRRRIHVKSFGTGKHLGCNEPQKHGDFNLCEYRFWQEDFWMPEGLGFEGRSCPSH